MQDETNTLVECGVMEKVTKPDKIKIIGCWWVYTTKRGSNDRIIRHKARMVAQGYKSSGRSWLRWNLFSSYQFLTDPLLHSIIHSHTWMGTCPYECQICIPVWWTRKWNLHRRSSWFWFTRFDKIPQVVKSSLRLTAEWSPRTGQDIQRIAFSKTYWY